MLSREGHERVAERLDKATRLCEEIQREADRNQRDDTAAMATAEAAILRLLSQRSGGATICPSEAAKVVEPDDWRSLMEPARSAARRLVASGDVVITQQGAVVDPSSAKGPIRIRRA